MERRSAQLVGRHRVKHSGVGLRVVDPITDAGVAQLAEQLICNQQVAGSSPIAGFCRVWYREQLGETQKSRFRLRRTKAKVDRSIGREVARVVKGDGL